jgi:hypothetical protein
MVAVAVDVCVGVFFAANTEERGGNDRLAVTPIANPITTSASNAIDCLFILHLFQRK